MKSPGRPTIALDAEVLLAHSTWLARLARALVVRNDEIDDVVQQTLAQALAKPPSHTTNIRAWLGTIAKNVVRSRRRSDTARVAREIALAPPSPIEDPADAVERAELRQLVVKAVLELDEPYRSALVLRFFEEMDVGAIGQMTESGEDTVRTRIRRGVIRVREQLERRIRDEARDEADGGAAATALLLVRLRNLASRIEPPDVPRATVSHRPSRLPKTLALRRLPVLTTAAAVLVAGWWWVQETRRSDRTNVVQTSATTRPSGAKEPSPPSLPAVASERAPDVVERSAPIAPSTATPTLPSRFAKRGVIRGVVTDPAGAPVAGARVWAMSWPDHVLAYKMPDFARTVQIQSETDPSLHGPGSWPSRTTGTDGRYEFEELSTMPGWAIGAYEPTVGAMLSRLQEFDRKVSQATVDLQLVPGSFVRGVVRDETGTPIGNADVRISLHDNKGGVSRLTAVAMPSGPTVGEFDFGFRCGEPIELEFRAPGFLDVPCTKVVVVAHERARKLEFTMRRKPGSLARGRIVDPQGRPLELIALLSRLFPTLKDDARAARVSVRAGAIEGHVDFVKQEYEFVFPEARTGTVELRIDEFVLASAEFDTSKALPDLPCDVDRLPKNQPTTAFAVRFVDADTRDPINLEREDVLPLASNGQSFAPILDEQCDRQRGLVVYACDPGSLKIEEWIDGYVKIVRLTRCPKDAPSAPLVFEIPRAVAAVRGTLFDSEGAPLARCPLAIFRATPSGPVDTTGFPLTSNTDGDFEVTGLAKGDHFVVVPGSMKEASAVARFVTGDPPPEIEIHTKAAAPTRFHILAPPSGSKPATRHFRVLDENGLIVASLNCDPRLKDSPDEFAVNVENGHYKVIVQRAGYRDASVDFDVPAAASVDVHLSPADAASK